MMNKKQSRCEKQLVKLDNFSHGVQLQVRGAEGYKTYLGSAFTIFCALIALTYSGNQFSIMASYGNTSYQVENRKNSFEVTDTLDAKAWGDALFFAVGFYNSNMTDFYKVASIEITMVSENWTGKPSSFANFTTGERILGLHPCSEDDIKRFYEFED